RRNPAGVRAYPERELAGFGTVPAPESDLVPREPETNGPRASIGWIAGRTRAEQTEFRNDGHGMVGRRRWGGRGARGRGAWPCRAPQPQPQRRRTWPDFSTRILLPPRSRWSPRPRPRTPSRTRRASDRRAMTSLTAPCTRLLRASP